MSAEPSMQPTPTPYQSSPQTSSSTDNTTLIIVVVVIVGSVLLAALVGVAMFKGGYFRRKNTNNSSSDGEIAFTVAPFWSDKHNLENGPVKESVVASADRTLHVEAPVTV